MSENLPSVECVEAKPYYSYQIKLLIDAFSQGELPEVESVDVEPRYGYVAAISYKSGSQRIIYGHDSGFNPSSSDSLAKDKGYTKFILRSIGVACPDGEEFLLPWWAERLRESDRQSLNKDIIDARSAEDYIDQTIGYPAIVKPATGSQGVGVSKVYTPRELNEALEVLNQERARVALVEESIDMPDFRLLMFDGQLVNAYERKPFSVVGDGSSTIEELAGERGRELSEVGRNIHIDRQMPNIHKKLGRLGLTFASVVPDGEKVQLLDISNLSAGGEPYDVTDIINKRWVDLADMIASKFSLRVCGVDLACSDISEPDSDYSVLEVNATPGAMQFMASSEESRDKLRGLFVRFFRTDQ